MNILITGASGFVGTNLVNKLSEKHNVRCVDRDDTFTLSGRDIVIHLACDGDSRASNSHIKEHTKNNLLLFTEILEAAINAGVKRFIYISSIEAEKELNVYAIEKRANEKILQVIAKEYGFDYVIIRPHTLFGEHMNLNDKNRNVIANFIKKTITGEEVEIIGDVNATRQFTYIEDLVKVIENSLTENTNQTITVTSGIETSIKDLDYMIKNLYKTILWVSSHTTE
jgi:nucleoside-diphosphate-sugar epimerase